MMPRSRTLALVATTFVLVAGCTGEPWDASTDASTGGGTEEPSTAPSPRIAGVPGVPGRIAALDETGTLTAFDADGSDAVVLAESQPDAFVVRQPAWSPDGARIAWVRLAANGTSADLVTTAADGSGPTETPMTAAAFYLSWDPTSARVAYLGGSATADIELGVVDVAAGSAAVTLDDGSPFYLSWDPSGRQLLVHVGRERLDRLALDGTLATVDDRPGVFNVPVWTADGRTFVYASVAGNTQRLVAHDLDEDRAETLLRFDGAVNFVVSPDGRRVAFQVVRDRTLVVPLSVIDRRTGAIEEVSEAVSPAFFWSPVGAKLLYLTPELTEERIWFRWGVWDDGSSFTTGRFVPSLQFSNEYLQFFEQYAQSMRLWAPDGSAFVYAGESETGETGVWIQPAASDAEPVLAADGVFATWSP
jgi:TolB protein